VNHTDFLFQYYSHIVIKFAVSSFLQLFVTFMAHHSASELGINLTSSVFFAVTRRWINWQEIIDRLIGSRVALRGLFWSHCAPDDTTTLFLATFRCNMKIEHTHVKRGV